MTSPPSVARRNATERLLALLSTGDFDGNDSRRLTAALAPHAHLLRAAVRLERGERTAAWAEVRAATAAAPYDGVVRLLASRLFYALHAHRSALDEAAAASDLGVSSAALLRYEQAREMGWYHEARSVLEQIVRSSAAPSAGAPAAESAAKIQERALGHLLRLYFDAHHYEAAELLLDEFLPRLRCSPRLSLQAARVYERRDQPEKASAAIRNALAAEPSPSTSLDAAQLFLEIGAFEEAAALYEEVLQHDASSRPALEALARLCLWRGDVTGAQSWAERLGALDERNTAARRMHAAIRVLDGDYAVALRELDAVVRDDPRDAEAFLWRAEAQLRLGRYANAQSDCDRAGSSFVGRSIRLLANLLQEMPVSPPIWQELSAELGAIHPDAAPVLAQGNVDDGIALLERALHALRGNRTTLPTWVRDEGGLALLPRSVSARSASRYAMELIKVASPEEALASLDAVARRFPNSAMPLVHRGELQLWLGNYVEARADLHAAIAMYPQTRWAWYGLACLDLMDGDPEGALATCARGIRVLHNTEGPVAFLYRGEAYRCLGRLEEAREQLERACELHPTRLSAWINLAMVHAAAADAPRQREAFARIALAAPALLSEAAQELGDDVFAAIVLEERVDGALLDRVLRHCLEMMRGNRSSSCVTYFSADGRLHYVPQPRDLPVARRERELRELAEIRHVILRAMQSQRSRPA